MPSPVPPTRRGESGALPPPQSDQPRDSLSDSEESLLAAVLNPQIPADSIDPLALSAALKNPAFTDAIQSRRFLDSLRLEQDISSTASRAVRTLATILDSSKDPLELRRAATSVTRLLSRAGACHRSSSSMIGASSLARPHL